MCKKVIFLVDEKMNDFIALWHSIYTNIWSKVYIVGRSKAQLHIFCVCVCMCAKMCVNYLCVCVCVCVCVKAFIVDCKIILVDLLFCYILIFIITEELKKKE